MIRIGIECKQLEGARFGVGQTLAQLLRALTMVPGLENKYRFILYFQSKPPREPFLEHPLFEKKILTGGIIPNSFNIFYHILLPTAYWRDRLDCFFFPSYMLPAFFLGKALVLLTNDVYWEAHFGTLPFRYKISYRLFCWLAARRARKIITISEFAKHELIKFYRLPDDTVAINPWGLDQKLQRFERTEEYVNRAARVKKRMGITGNFFLSIGQAFPRRHMKEAIEAFAEVAKKDRNIQYFLACSDKYNPPILENLIKKVNTKMERKAIINWKEHFSGELREDLIVLMNEMLALIYVSDKEALGLPPLEALVCGRPAIVADNEISHEIFGQSGFFVASPVTSQRIEQQMMRILETPTDITAIITAQTPRLSFYRWEQHVERFLHLIDKVCAC